VCICSWQAKKLPRLIHEAAAFIAVERMQIVNTDESQTFAPAPCRRQPRQAVGGWRG
jgi:hypothetical protein